MAAADQRVENNSSQVLATCLRQALSQTCILLPSPRPPHGSGTGTVASQSRRARSKKKKVGGPCEWEVPGLAFGTRSEPLMTLLLCLEFPPSRQPASVSEFHPLIGLAWTVPCSFLSHCLSLCGSLAASATPPARQLIAVRIGTLVLRMWAGCHLGSQKCTLRPPQACGVRMCVFPRCIEDSCAHCSLGSGDQRSFKLDSVQGSEGFPCAPCSHIPALKVKTWLPSSPGFSLRLSSTKMKRALS